MSGFIGADTDELRDAGQKCEQGADTADQVITFLKALVIALKAASFFTGGASAAYATYLETVVIPWLQKVSMALHLFAKVLGAHAEAQDKASAGETVDFGSLPTYQTPGSLPAGSTSSYPPIVAPTSPGAGAGSTGGTTGGAAGGATGTPGGTPGTTTTTTVSPDGTTTTTTTSGGVPTTTTTGGSIPGSTPGTSVPTHTPAANPVGAGHAAGLGGGVPGGGSGGATGGGSGGGIGGGTGGGAGSGVPGAEHGNPITGGGVPGGSPAVDAATTYSGSYQPGDASTLGGQAGTPTAAGGLSGHGVTAAAAGLGAAGALGLGGAALAAKGKGAGAADGAINSLIDSNGRGSKGNDVAELQKQLSKAGYDTQGVDGVWGKNTQAAVDQYRADHPVPITPGEGHFAPSGYDYNKITGVAGNSRVTPEFLRKVEQVAANVGTKPEYLMGVISAETNGTFSSSIKNPHSTATGLIQFTRDTATGLGTSTTELRGMTPVQQLDYVEKYLAPRRGHLGSVEGLYSTVLAGRGATTEDPGAALLTKGARNGYEGNSYLDLDHNGSVSAKEAADSIRARIRR